MSIIILIISVTDIHRCKLLLFRKIAVKMKKVFLIDHRTSEHKHSCQYKLHFFCKKFLEAHMVDNFYHTM